MTKFLNVMNVKNIFYQNIGKEFVVKLRTGGVFILNNIYEAENDEHGGAFSAFIIESHGLDAKKKALFCAGSAMELSECDIVWIKNQESGELIYEAEKNK
jgi:hypothetical protein